MDSFAQFSESVGDKNLVVKDAVHPDLHSKMKPFYHGGVAGVKIKTPSTKEFEIHDKIHSHLVSKGYKRNPALSEPKAHTYQHADGKKIHVTHYKGETVVEHD